MGQYITDTHGLLWHLTSDPQLSLQAKSVFVDTDKGNHRIFIPSIVLVEIIYLAEKKRIESRLVDQVFCLLEERPLNYSIAPLDIYTVRTLREIDRIEVPDMPDRIIAATARLLGLPLITRDTTIASVPGVMVVW